MPSFERKGIFSDKLLLSPARDVRATCRIRLQHDDNFRPRIHLGGCSLLSLVRKKPRIHSGVFACGATALSPSMIEALVKMQCVRQTDYIIVERRTLLFGCRGD